jgi:hypothetical protein
MRAYFQQNAASAGIILGSDFNLGITTPRPPYISVLTGDATVNGEEVTTTDTMATWAQEAGLRLERSIPKIVFGLYSVIQDERILIFRKP